MSCSYNAGVILGVKLDKIGFKAELVKVPYEVFDKKGKPTGKFDYDSSWKITFKDEEKIEDGERLYTDTIYDIDKVNKPLKFIDLNNDGFFIDNIIIGINLAKKGYGYEDILEEFGSKYDAAKLLIVEECKKQFGVDVEPELYFYFNVSC